MLPHDWNLVHEATIHLSHAPLGSMFGIALVVSIANCPRYSATFLPERHDRDMTGTWPAQPPYP